MMITKLLVRQAKQGGGRDRDVVVVLAQGWSHLHLNITFTLDDKSGTVHGRFPLALFKERTSLKLHGTLGERSRCNLEL